jgi:VanZ family protein
MSYKRSVLNRIAQNKEIWLSWGMVFGWMGLIFFFSHQPSLPHLPDGMRDTIIKKLGHALAYGILMGLWQRALSAIRPMTSKMLWLALGLTLLYAISDEWHQTFIPDRNGQLADVLVDLSGAWLVLIVSRRLMRRNSKNVTSDARMEMVGVEK